MITESENAPKVVRILGPRRFLGSGGDSLVSLQRNVVRHSDSPGELVKAPRRAPIAVRQLVLGNSCSVDLFLFGGKHVFCLSRCLGFMEGCSSCCP